MHGKGMNSSLFDFTGFAARTDLEKEGWKVLFSSLQGEQAEFLKHQDKFRSKEYKWPRDPLHTWSRLWEYPYVHHHIQKTQAQRPSEKLQILDFGSGVTFFPFAAARLGCDVTCADIDPVCAADIPEAAKWVEHASGSVNVALIKNGRIPVESESQDVVYCISVLEHISDFESVIDEMARVLKPHGQIILTVDIDLRGNYEMGVNAFEYLQTKLDEHFIRNLPERPVHPCNLLTTANSPYHMKRWSPFLALRRFVGGCLRGKIVMVGPLDLLYLAVYSDVRIKRQDPRSSRSLDPRASARSHPAAV